MSTDATPLIPGTAVVQCARRMLGTPWMHQARLPGQAVDCAGLVICVARELGLVSQDWDLNAYPRTPDGTLDALCAAHMTPIGALEPGAVLLLSVERDPQHLGIVADYLHGGWSIVHASSPAGRVIETRLLFTRNFVRRGLYRLPGVAA